MPSSIYQNIPTILTEIMLSVPNSILDIGVGFGKTGFLCREYLEVWNKRLIRSEWRVRIDGIEICERYVTPVVNEIYNNIYIGDASQVINSLDFYDVIVANDVIEHIEKKKALGLLKTLSEKFNKKMILSIPLGDKWLDANKSFIDINPAEAHISAWTQSELEAMPYFKYSFPFQGVRGPIGLFIYEK